MKIIIAGDLYIADEFRNRNLIDKSVIDLFETADYRIVNLEAPITEDIPKNKIIKTGPHLRMSSDTIMPYLHQLKIDAVTMANNHILDYGYKGVKDTFKELVDHKIKYIGAGNDLTEARKPLSLHKDGMKIAILNFCENEWSIAEADKPGANPMDIIDNTKQIKAAKATNDKVICIIHGGHEYYNLPSPRMQKQYRFYVDNGADAIIGHHTHCISGYEIYKEAPILYSLGNFIFTEKSLESGWYKGLIVKIKIEKSVRFKLYPTQQNEITDSINLINGPNLCNITNYLQKLNTVILDYPKLFAQWTNYINEKQKNYLKYISPINGINNKYIRYILLKLFNSINYNNYRYIINMTNILRCESHFDVLKNIFCSIANNKK